MIVSAPVARPPASPRGMPTCGCRAAHAPCLSQPCFTSAAFLAWPDLRRSLRSLPESNKDQQEVTDQLGYQVRRAVEMLVQAFRNRLDVESGRTLADVTKKDLRQRAHSHDAPRLPCSPRMNAAFLLGDPLYDQHYAVSTLSEPRTRRFNMAVLERRR